MELLDEVFIKEQSDTKSDRVFIVKNLPKKFIYRQVPKMVCRVDRDGYSDGVMIPDPKGEMVEGFIEGVELSQCGDGAIVFPTKHAHVREALKVIDAYIAGTLPRDVIIPSRVPYALDPTHMMSQPKPKSLIPVIELPIPKAATAPVSPEANPSPVSPAPLKKKRQLTEQQKTAAKERLARAREIKKQLLEKE